MVTNTEAYERLIIADRAYSEGRISKAEIEAVEKEVQWIFASGTPVEGWEGILARLWPEALKWTTGGRGDD